MAAVFVTTEIVPNRTDRHDPEDGTLIIRRKGFSKSHGLRSKTAKTCSAKVRTYTEHCSAGADPGTMGDVGSLLSPNALPLRLVLGLHVKISRIGVCVRLDRDYIYGSQNNRPVKVLGGDAVETHAPNDSSDPQ